MVTETAEITAAKLTCQDYFDLDAPEGERYELIDGELIKLESPTEAHQGVSIALSSRMHIFTHANGLGLILHAPYDVVLSETDVVQPDILFVSNERARIRTPDNIQGAPDLLVEILLPSSAKRDWRDKFDLYAKRGVKEYWIIDPINPAIWITRLENGARETSGPYIEGDTASSSALAGFSVKVDDIF